MAIASDLKDNAEMEEWELISMTPQTVVFNLKKIVIVRGEVARRRRRLHEITACEVTLRCPDTGTIFFAVVCESQGVYTDFCSYGHWNQISPITADVSGI